MDVVMSGMCSQEWGCGCLVGCVPAPAFAGAKLGGGMDRDLCIPQEPYMPVSCHPLLPQLSITGAFSHHT